MIAYKIAPKMLLEGKMLILAHPNALGPQLTRQVSTILI